MYGVFNVYGSVISRGQHFLTYLWYGPCVSNTNRHSTKRDFTPHLWRHKSIPDTLECLENINSMLDIFINELVTKLCSKRSKRGWHSPRTALDSNREWGNLNALKGVSRVGNKTVYDEIISTVPNRLIRALNTYSMRTTRVCGMSCTTFSWKNRKKKKRDNFFKTIFQHDPEHLGQMWVVCMQFRHSRAGLHTQNGVKRTTIARNMASNVNPPCFEAKSATPTTGPYLRTSISRRQHNIFQHLKVNACIVGQALSLRIKG